MVSGDLLLPVFGLHHANRIWKCGRACSMIMTHSDKSTNDYIVAVKIRNFITKIYIKSQYKENERKLLDIEHTVSFG